MRTNWITLALIATVAAPSIAAAQSNPCADRPCNIVFDWGNGSTSPDVDRKYGAPSELESIFTNSLMNSGWKLSAAGQSSSSMTITMRITQQKKALCDTMPGVNPDYSCHTVARAAVVFTPNDSTQKPVPRVEITPRCSDPKGFPSFNQFGKYAAEVVNYVVVAGEKGNRPSVKCV